MQQLLMLVMDDLIELATWVEGWQDGAGEM